MKNLSILLLILFAALGACRDMEDPNAEIREIMERQEVQIKEHLEDNQIVAEIDDFGIYRTKLVENEDGEEIVQGDVALIKYKITQLDGTLIGESGEDSVRVRFDSQGSYQPVSLYLGLRHMRKGEKYRFYSTLSYGYTYNDYSLVDVVPRRSITVLELEVLDIYKNDTELRIADIATIERIMADIKETEGLVADTLRPTGVRKVILEPGEGTVAKEDDAVGFYYRGRFLNGEQFDSNTSGTAFRFTLGRGSVIPGFEAAAGNMLKGEKARIFIPSAQAYGKTAPGTNENAWFVIPEAVRKDLAEDTRVGRYVSFPPYSILEFELELREITRSPE